MSFYCLWSTINGRIEETSDKLHTGQQATDSFYRILYWSFPSCWLARTVNFVVSKWSHFSFLFCIFEADKNTTKFLTCYSQHVWVWNWQKASADNAWSLSAHIFGNYKKRIQSIKLLTLKSVFLLTLCKVELKQSDWLIWGKVCCISQCHHWKCHLLLLMV